MRTLVSTAIASDCIHIEFLDLECVGEALGPIDAFVSTKTVLSFSSSLFHSLFIKMNACMGRLT